MKKVQLIVILLISVCAKGFSQETVDLKEFSGIITSPRVRVVLSRGDKESVRIDYHDIPKERVNVKVSGNKLKIYLDHARITEKQVKITYNNSTTRHGIYEGYYITAYVTYRKLNKLEIRGAEDIRCDDPIETRKFKLKAYGESHIVLSNLKADRFKASLYGENELKITSGTTEHQVYRLFGANQIDTEGLVSQVAKTRIYGEGLVTIKAMDHVRVNALGEPIIQVAGTSYISKGIVIGETRIRISSRQ